MQRSWEKEGSKAYRWAQQNVPRSQICLPFHSSSVDSECTACQTGLMCNSAVTQRSVASQVHLEEEERDSAGTDWGEGLQNGCFLSTLDLASFWVFAARQRILDCAIRLSWTRRGENINKSSTANQSVVGFRMPSTFWALRSVTFGRHYWSNIHTSTTHAHSQKDTGMTQMMIACAINSVCLQGHFF